MLGVGAVKRKLVWPEYVVLCCAFSILLSSKGVSVSIHANVYIAVTRDNKGKPSELSSENEVKMLILKILCKLRMSLYNVY